MRVVTSVLRRVPARRHASTSRQDPEERMPSLLPAVCPSLTTLIHCPSFFREGTPHNLGIGFGACVLGEKDFTWVERRADRSLRPGCLLL
ncbi:hypothetical protein E2C01_014556 [Portunus trituberculatus]|uniref:Uncharacterized protein n=1 Tax=Portunus trituberculatus TaxID=210409 RepID=A0A5B7DJJ9_PORTR|nr:hypothetical protein [Portunus trituberculatus]